MEKHINPGTEQSLPEICFFFFIRDHTFIEEKNERIHNGIQKTNPPKTPAKTTETIPIQNNKTKLIITKGPSHGRPQRRVKPNCLPKLPHGFLHLSKYSTILLKPTTPPDSKKTPCHRTFPLGFFSSLQVATDYPLFLSGLVFSHPMELQLSYFILFFSVLDIILFLSR